MSDTIKVESIEIKIGDKTINLSPAELQELRDVLDATFPKLPINYIPYAPIIIERPVAPEPWPRRYWEQPLWVSDQHSMRIECKT